MVATHYQNVADVAYNANVRQRSTPTPHRNAAPKQDKRFRLQHRFWLDMTKPREFNLAETIEAWKMARIFASTVRDALLLIDDLRQGRVTQLERLFPWIKEHYAPLKPPPAPDTSALEARLAKLEAMLAQGSAPVGGPKPLNGGPKPLTQAAPDDDDTVLLTMKKAKSDGTKSASNFLDSAFGLLG